jgi:hypothetical protein
MQKLTKSENFKSQWFLPIFQGYGYISSAQSTQTEHPVKTAPYNSSLSDPVKNAKYHFTNRFPHINTEYYSNLTKTLLDKIYPKYCPKCNTRLTKDITNRESSIRCPKCHHQTSRTSQTPLHNLRLPLWVFSYILVESLHLFPQVLTATSIQRRLVVSNNTALKLKRRLQIFLSEFTYDIRHIVSQEIAKEFGENFRLPKDNDTDLTDLVKEKPVVSIDSCAIFSASQRANGYRKRYKHHGLTSSIYLSDQVALEHPEKSYQIGTLAHTIAIKGGAVIFDSIPDTKQKTVQNLLRFLPEHAPIFSDEGYPWLKRYNYNHRSVNHSKRAKDKNRNKWGRDRWSCKGVHSQTAEGFQRVLKHSFLAGYGYIRPKYSQLYLNEWSALKAIKLYGIDRLIDQREERDCVNTAQPICTRESNKKSQNWTLYNEISKYLYNIPTLESRIHLNLSQARKQIPKRLKTCLDMNEFFELKQAVMDYQYFWEESNIHRKQKESEYNAIAHRLFLFLSEKEYRSLDTACKAGTINKKKVLRVVRTWAKYGIADVKEIRRRINSDVNYIMKRNLPVCPDILYTYTLDEIKELGEEWENIEITHPKQEERKGKYGLTQSERKQFINKIKE